MNYDVKKAVVLCAGRGVRLGVLSRYLPKAMLPLGEKPALHYLLEEISIAGIKEVLLIVGHHKNAIEQYFYEYKNEKEFERIQDLEIKFLTQDALNGTGGGVLLAKNFVGKHNFLVAFADDVTKPEDKTCAKLINQFKKVRENVMAVREVEMKNAHKYGIVFSKNIDICKNKKSFSKNIFQVGKIIEKPEKPESNLVNFGRYVFTPQIFDILKGLKPHKNNEIYLTDALSIILKNELYAFKIQNPTFDLGSAQTYIKAFISFNS